MAILTNLKVLTRLLQKHLQVQYIPEDSKHHFLIKKTVLLSVY